MDAFVFLFSGTLGLLLGSFVNVVASRGPRAWGLADDDGLPRNVAYPPSQCDGCDRRLHPLELVPVASFLMLAGRCRTCGAAIGLRHVIVEILGGVIGVAIAWRFGATPEAIAVAIFLFTALAAGAIDWETGYLPDALTLPLIPLGLGASLLLPHGVISGVLGMVMAGGGSWLLAAGYKRLRGFEGLGGGDVKLLAAIGAWTGVMAVPFVLLLSSVTGILAALLAMLRSRSGDGLRMEIRFGPFLGFGAAAVLLFAPPWVFA